MSTTDPINSALQTAGVPSGPDMSSMGIPGGMSLDPNNFQGGGNIPGTIGGGMSMMLYSLPSMALMFGGYYLISKVLMGGLGSIFGRAQGAAGGSGGAQEAATKLKLFNPESAGGTAPETLGAKVGAALKGPVVSTALRLAGLVGGSLMIADAWTDTTPENPSFMAAAKGGAGGAVAGYSLAGIAIGKSAPAFLGSAAARIGITTAGAGAVVAGLTAGGVLLAKYGHDRGDNLGIGLSVAGCAIAGATIGSIIPVIGTAIGLVGGAIVGGIAGFFYGKAGKDEKQAAQTKELSGLKAQFRNAVAQSGIEEKIKQFNVLRAGGGEQASSGQGGSANQPGFLESFEKEAGKLPIGEQVERYKQGLARLPQVTQQIENQSLQIKTQIAQKESAEKMALLTEQMMEQANSMKQLFAGSLGFGSAWGIGGFGLGSNPLSGLAGSNPVFSTFSSALGGLGQGLPAFGRAPSPYAIAA